MAVGKIAGLPRTHRRTKRIDTIPKLCGLSSGGPVSGLYVPILSRTCPAFVSVLSRSAFVRPHFALRRTHGRQVSRCSEERRRETRPLAFGALWRIRGRSCDRQGVTCRDIAALLAEKCQFKTSKSAVSRLVRARARRRRNGARQISRHVAISPPIVAKRAGLYSGPGPSENEIQQRIAAMKARKPAPVSI